MDNITFYLTISVDGHSGCLHFWDFISNAAVNIHDRVFVWTYVFISLGWVPSCGIAGLSANSALNILRNHQTAL